MYVVLAISFTHRRVGILHFCGELEVYALTDFKFSRPVQH